MVRTQYCGARDALIRYRPVVGCGLNFSTREVFFTLNGKHLGVAFTDVDGLYYPTVGLHSPSKCLLCYCCELVESTRVRTDELVVFNFGASPFAFDLQYFASEAEEIRAESIKVFELRADIPLRLIQDYLLQYG